MHYYFPAEVETDQGRKETLAFKIRTTWPSKPKAAYVTVSATHERFRAGAVAIFRVATHTIWSEK